uniref:Septin-type G domain-containing protein n=1 Tax=Tetradesmus obliquus TaxID=3088 RepID=A0A383WIM5_TETOB
MKDYEMLAGSRGLNEAAMCGQLQHSITACVYFLSPHRVKKVDLIIMSALSQLVTVIPVIAKADTMTDKELSAFRSEVRAMLSCPSKYAPSKTLAPLDFNTFGFAPQVLTDLGITPDAMPLALITSNEHESLRDSALAAELGLDQPEVQQPVRNYRWGAAYALNREHSDLLTLKRLLLGDKVDSLYAMLDESYNRCATFYFYALDVRAMLSCPSKYAPSKTLAPLDFNTFGFAPQVLTDLGITPDAMPLALITSNEHESLRDSALAAELGLDQPEVQQPVRNYRWGAAYALNREHSDLLTLKRLLLGDKVDSLYAMLDESYNRYLNFCQQYEANGKQLPLIVQNAAAMCTPYLEYDDYSNAKTALDSAQQAMSTLMAENKALMERINVLERSGNMSRY